MGPEVCEGLERFVGVFLVLLGADFDFAAGFGEFVCAWEMDFKIFENHGALGTRESLDPSPEAEELRLILLLICLDYLKPSFPVANHSSLYVGLYC